MEHVSKTQLYLKVKKPLLERQRRARINKCLDAMKQIVAELQDDNAILRMDKAEMLEATIAHLRQTKYKNNYNNQLPVDGFRNGYINAANEVSRVLASTRGISTEFGKAVMTHLGCQFSRLQEMHHQQQMNIANQKAKYMQQLHVKIPSAPLSPASSGYHSDKESPVSSPVPQNEQSHHVELWRPW